MTLAQPAPRAPLLDLILQLFLDGQAVAHDDADFHRARITWEWESGQWTMLTGEDDRLWGWLSYYRVSPAVLDLLRHRRLDDLFSAAEHHAALDLTHGPHIYFATALVTPWAPRNTFQWLCRAAMRHHRDAVSVSWHHRYPDGRSRFVCRPPDHEIV